MNKGICVVFFFFVSQMLSTSINGQVRRLRFQHYTTDDGLSQADIFHIAQDSRGFMWFATYDGLNRFDGYDFKVFRPYHNDINSIKGGHINNIIEDSKQMIWVGTDEALNCYNTITNSFEQFYIEDSLKQKLKVSYNPFFIDDENELWFTYKINNLASFNLLSKKITTYPFADGAVNEFTISHYPEQEFYRPLLKIYTAGIDGLHIIDINNQKINYYFSGNLSNLTGKKTLIRQVLADKYQVLWLASKDGLMSFNPLNEEIHLYNAFNNSKKISNLSCLVRDKDDNIWCGSYGTGLSLFNTSSKTFTRNYIKYPADPESIAQNAITSLFKDKDNNIWMGIDLYGIDKINPSYEQLNHVRLNSETKTLDYTSSIWSVAEIDDNSVLICSNHQDLMVYNKSNGESKQFYLPNGYKDSTVYSTILDSKKRIWIASDVGLFYSDDQMNTVSISIKKNIFYGACLFEFNKKIYAGTGNGLFTIPMDKNISDVYTLHLFDGKKINCITSSPQGLLCVATGNKELYLLAMDGLKIVREKKIPFDFQIKSIFFQQEDILWLGTSSGLVKYDISKNSVKVFTEKNGLANNFVYCVLKGNDGNLWMSTNHGISKFNMTTERFGNYGLPEGAQSLEFNTNSFFQSAGGTIYFGGVKGFNYFNPSSIKEFDFAPPLEILSISVNGHSVSLSAMMNLREPVKFKNNENNIAIEFAAIDFNRNDNINYLYRLNSNDEWSSIGKLRTLSFANLSPGDYYLEIGTQYSYNTVSPRTLKFTFTVLPPFYKTLWFIAIICAILIGLIFSVYKYRIGQLLKLQAIRNNIARDLHDEVGATLSGISMYSHLTKEQIKQSDNVAVEKSLNIIQQNAAEMVNKLNDIVWLVNPDQDSLQKLIQRLEEYATDMTVTKGMQIKIISPSHFRHEHLPMLSRRNIYLFCKEAINNAVKYSEASELQLIVKETGNLLDITLSDNGNGFEKTNVKPGNGLINMQKRAEEIGAAFYLQTVVNEGCSVSIQIKIT